MIKTGTGALAAVAGGPQAMLSQLTTSEYTTNVATVRIFIDVAVKELAHEPLTSDALQRLTTAPVPLPDWAITTLVNLTFWQHAVFACEVAVGLVSQPIQITSNLLFGLMRPDLLREAVQLWKREGFEAGRLRLLLHAGAWSAIGRRSSIAEGLVVPLAEVVLAMQNRGAWPLAPGAEDTLLTVTEARLLLGDDYAHLGDAEVRALQGYAERLARHAHKMQRGFDPFRAALDTLPEGDRHAVEERAAIIEHDGRLSRDHAERWALARHAENSHGAR